MPTPNRYNTLLAFLAWLAFVVYGSLLPFELRGITLDQAIATFSNIRFLDLGVVSRADWVANILLYIPLAFFACSWIAGPAGRSSVNVVALTLTLLICLGTAVGVEFAQTFYAPRTVSLNDLLAEGIGSVLGGVICLSYRDRIQHLLRAFAEGGGASIHAAISLYGIAYLLMSLFPYDVLISMDELRAKFASNMLGWVLAANCESGLRCGAQMLGEVLAIAPLGLLLALARPRLSLRRVFVLGVALGLALELAQLFIASGTSQGLSVLLRGGGLVAGVLLGQYLRQHGVIAIARIIRRLTPLLLLPYLATIAALSGWFKGPWVDIGTAIGRLPDLKLLPFYYHYFSTETHAVASLLAQLAMYAPVGIAVWARQASRPQRGFRRAHSAAITAVLVALPIEFGKLMSPPQHPDLTNLLIAACGALFAYRLAVWVSMVVAGLAQGSAAAPVRVQAPGPPPEPQGPSPGSRPPRPPVRPLGLAVSLVAAGALLAGVLHYPLYSPLLAGLLAGYAFLLYRNPWLWLLVLPIALPAVDLSPLAGRQLLDTFDMVVLVTLVMGYWSIYPLRARSWPRLSLALAVALLWLSWLIAFSRGIWPLRDVPAAIVESSHTPWEAWFVGKGLLWALLLVPLLRRVPREMTARAQSLLISGIVLGLSLVVGMVVWERYVFVGLGDFENIFRVTGPFASMHTGGAYIEAYLACAFPVLVVWILRQHRWSHRFAGLLLVIGSAYAMSVTYSRGGYAGLLISLLVVAGGTALQRRGTARHAKLALAATLAGALAVAIPVVSGEFAQYRLKRSLEDLNIRLAHWRQAVSFMDDGVLTAISGMGFGRYPTQYLYRIGAGRESPGNFSILHEHADTFLRLVPGDALYLEQVVAIEPDSSYTLSARVRQPAGPATLSVPICEKALLYSFDCEWSRLKPQKPAGWQVLTRVLHSGQLGAGGSWPHRTVKLSLYNSGSQHPLDVDWISLKDAQGREMLSNGGFDQGADRWLFVTDRDLAWHIHQQQVETYFAQGLLGLLALLVLILASARILGRAILAGSTFALAMSGALAGFLAVGFLGSTVDTARLSMLFYFGALSGALLSGSRRGHRSHSHFPPGVRTS